MIELRRLLCGGMPGPGRNPSLQAVRPHTDMGNVTPMSSSETSWNNVYGFYLA